MSIQRSPIGQASALNTASDSNCAICSESMSGTQECIILSQCSHTFHRRCIENYLSQSAECPICKRPCELSELRTVSTQHLANTLPTEADRTSEIATQTNAKQFKPSVRGKSRGAISRAYQTRSVSRTLFQDPNQLIDFQNTSNVAPQVDDLAPESNSIGQNPTNNSNNTPMRSVNNSIDYTVINRMIESSISRVLGNLNIHAGNSNNTNVNGNRSEIQSQHSHNINRNIHVSDNETSQPNIQPSHQPPFVYTSNIQLDAGNRTPVSHDSVTLRADKITSIIKNWNIKFDGSAQGLSVDEFLYRIRSLTADNFDNDFSIICRNLTILLTGKALAWFWRYHKQVATVVWDDFCVALRYQFKDFKTDFDIREELRNRKQKPNESFELFYESVSTMIDRLSTPISEEDLIEILTRNLRPEIRHELLYVPILSIAHLRKLVQMRENLFNDEYARRNIFNKSHQQIPRKSVSEIEHCDVKLPCLTEIEKLSVDAVNHTYIPPKCWNCSESGHLWEDCLKERTIFCYGCGAKNTYKPNCLKCTTKRISAQVSLNSGQSKNQ